VEAYESEVESWVCGEALIRYGIFSIKIKSAQENGYPDRQFLIRGGVPLFIEFKRPGEEPEPYQKLIHERLRYAGYEVQVHSNREEALQAIKAAMEAGKDAADRRRMAGPTKRGGAAVRPRKRKD